MIRTLATDIGSVITTRMAAAIAAATAGAAGDGTVVTGFSIDRQAIGMPSCAEFALFCQATLAATKTLAVSTLKVQDSADGASFADYVDLVGPGPVLTGAAGGSTEHGQVRKRVNLSSARRYVRVSFTPDLSAAATDTATIAAAFVFSGFDELPSPV